MSDTIGDRLSQLAEGIHNCSDNGQSDAANMLRYEAEKLLESVYSEARISQKEASYADTK